MDFRQRITRNQGLTRLELQTKATWIRDTLEPYIAQNGPEPLSPDTVLDLAAFFSRLLSQTTSQPTVQTIFPDTGPSNAVKLHITLEDIRISRIHRALLVITGRGTRWPGKLIEICDTLVAAWTEQFGDLNMLRPLLYEKGGRLHEVRAEKEMTRHALLLKWLSDRSSLVSPLRALESGHLEFKPGQWWIHSIFAFYDGIIDSPDPHGGITADADGAYAITLTGGDEVESPSPETFTYRIRKDDKGKHRLLQAFLPHKQSIRVLRSHTLHSMWSPVAGLRYDGLYKISSFSVSTDKDKAVRYEVKMQREPDQVSIRDVRKHPTAEEVDDYIEYKRLRYLRLDKLRDPAKRVPKAEQVLGYIPLLQATTVEFDHESEAAPRQRRGAVNFWDHQFERTMFTARSGFKDDDSDDKQDNDDEPVIASLDGAPLQPTCSNPSAHSSLHEFKESSSNPVKQKRRGPLPMGPLRNCCETQTRDESKSRHVEIRTRQDSAFDFAENYCQPVLHHEAIRARKSEQSLNHAELQTLKENIKLLTEVTKSHGGMSRTFLEDVKGMTSIVNQWEKENVARDGYVDRCLWDVTEAIDELRECDHVVWNAPWLEDDEPGGELDRLSKYQGTWRRGSMNGWKDMDFIHVGDIRHVPLGSDQVCSEGCIEMPA